jgi:hypothetical protein
MVFGILAANVTATAQSEDGLRGGPATGAYGQLLEAEREVQAAWTALQEANHFYDKLEAVFRALENIGFGLVHERNAANEGLQEHERERPGSSDPPECHHQWRLKRDLLQKEIDEFEEALRELTPVYRKARAVRRQAAHDRERAKVRYELVTARLREIRSGSVAYRIESKRYDAEWEWYDRKKHFRWIVTPQVHYSAGKVTLTIHEECQRLKNDPFSVIAEMDFGTSGASLQRITIDGQPQSHTEAVDVTGRERVHLVTQHQYMGRTWQLSWNVALR